MAPIDSKMEQIASFYLRCLAVVQAPEKERKWYPKWFGAYVRFHSLHLADCPIDRLPMDNVKVIAFLRNLRDSTVQAWQRLQAVEALCVYHTLVYRDDSVDFKMLRTKLRELSEVERRGGNSAGDVSSVPGEGNAGLLEKSESTTVVEMRKKLRLLHYPLSTEDAYIRWVKRFIEHIGDDKLHQYGAEHIAEFLTDLAVGGEVAASTQNQALNGILFYYEKVLGQSLTFISSVRARVSTYRPTVLTKSEIVQLGNLLSGTDSLMFWLMYGGGLRHKECRCLRVKDVCVENRQIIVRDTKGREDRVTVLPDRIADRLKLHIEDVRRLHRADLSQGFGTLPIEVLP